MPHQPRPAVVTRGALTRLVGVLTAALMLSATVGAVPAAATTADPAATAAELDAERAEAERAEVERLEQQALLQQQALADAQALLDQLSAQAGQAMERYQTALREADEADAERALQQERLGVAEAVLAGNRSDLGRWASKAYRDGGGMARYEELMTLLESDSTDDLSQRLAMLRTVGRVRSGAVEVAEQAQAVQQDAARRSLAAARDAEAAAQRAATAKQEADALLEAQRAQLAALDELLARTVGDAHAAEARAAQLALAHAAAEQRRMAAAATAGRRGGNAVTGAVGDCAGGDVSRYGNGAIPVSALCPLPGAAGHVLRADAAHAFSNLARAYSAAFGTDLCITDSYRTVASQVRLYATKPDLAAVPGTSNHGWGTAVDLCGGIERFGTAQHQWMRNTASLYGWFHPGWAQAGGSRPEPWHWEYGG